jgi:hypothetical protein
MESFIIGLALGGVGVGLAFWARARDIHIKWYAWIFIVFAVLVLALLGMDFRTFTVAIEPDMAAGALILYGIPGLVSALIAIGLIWWGNKRPSTASTDSE